MRPRKTTLVDAARTTTTTKHDDDDDDDARYDHRRDVGEETGRRKRTGSLRGFTTCAAARKTTRIVRWWVCAASIALLLTVARTGWFEETFLEGGFLWDRYYDRRRGGGTPVRFVLHVGPGKTGTTTLQEALGSSKLSRLLDLDGYEYIGRYVKWYVLPSDHGVLQRDAVQTRDARSGRYEFSRRFLNTVRGALYRRRRNIVGSNEYYATMNPEQIEGWKRLFEAVAGGRDDDDHPVDIDDAKLVVVVSYRRFHDWVPSQWNQLYKKKRNRRTGKILGSSHSDWPGTNGDYRIRSFREHFEDEYYHNHHHPAAALANGDIGDNRTTTTTRMPPPPPDHPAKLAYEAWREVADEIVLLNLHELEPSSSSSSRDDDATGGDEHPPRRPDLVENFVCRALPGADRACSALRGEALAAADDAKPLLEEGKRSNPSEGLDSDLLAVRAFETDLVDPSRWSRTAASTAVDRHLAERPDLRDALPRDCLSPTALGYLRRRSLDFEEWFFATAAAATTTTTSSSSSSSRRLITPVKEEDPRMISSDFEADWDRAVAEGKFCSVDADAALAQEEWRSFFRRFS